MFLASVFTFPYSLCTIISFGALAYVSQKSRNLFKPENFSELFSGAFLGFPKAFLKAPDFRPIFSGIFSGLILSLQPVIGVKLTVDTAVLSWFPHVRIKIRLLYIMLLLLRYNAKKMLHFPHQNARLAPKKSLKC